MTATSAPPRRGPRTQPPPARRRRGLVLPAAGITIAALAVVALIVTAGGPDTAGMQETAPVAVAGAPLPLYTGEGADPAVGMPAPGLRGTDFGGRAMDFSPGEHPTVLLFAAHWCGFCQQEVDELAPWLADGGQGSVSFVTIATGVDASRPNYPPSAWFEREGWPGAVLTDSAASEAAQAYGLSGYPYFVFVDGDGTVVARTSGNLGPEALSDAMDRLLAD